MIGEYREAANTAEMAHRVLGLVLFGMEDYPAAIDSLKTVTDFNPRITWRMCISADVSLAWRSGKNPLRGRTF